jgi:hypothetical protein
MLTVSAAAAVFDLRGRPMSHEMEDYLNVAVIILDGIRRLVVEADVTSYRGFEAKNKSTLVVKGDMTIYGPVSLR